MPNKDKQLTHKSVAILIEDYEEIQKIASELSDEKGVPVSIGRAIRLIREYWQQNRGKV